MKVRTLLFLGFTMFLMAAPVMADVGLTGNCQDDARSLQDEMKNNKDEYTVESRTRATSEIAAAKTNLLNPVKCRKNLLDAHKELLKGKKDKKNKKD